jgi:hypothetical protein
MLYYTATGPTYTTQNPLLESLIVCLFSILMLVTL